MTVQEVVTVQDVVTAKVLVAVSEVVTAVALDSVAEHLKTLTNLQGRTVNKVGEDTEHTDGLAQCRMGSRLQ